MRGQTPSELWEHVGGENERRECPPPPPPTPTRMPLFGGGSRAWVSEEKRYFHMLSARALRRWPVRGQHKGQEQERERRVCAASSFSPHSAVFLLVFPEAKEGVSGQTSASSRKVLWLGLPPVHSGDRVLIELGGDLPLTSANKGN